MENIEKPNALDEKSVSMVMDYTMYSDIQTGQGNTALKISAVYPGTVNTFSKTSQPIEIELGEEA